jgi:hypothetical protein
MEKVDLLGELDRATDKAASYAIQRGFPIPITKKATLIGNLFIEKNSNNFYDVITFDRTVLFENISVFDVAVIVAQRYSSGDSTAIRQVLELEGKFSKYHTDMIYYLHCMKGAKKKQDSERLAILEDKFQMAEMLAKDTRDKITVFKRVK